MIATCMEPMNFSAKRRRANRHSMGKRQPETTSYAVSTPDQRATASGTVILDAPDLRRTAAQIISDHAFPVQPGNWLELTSLINFASLNADLQNRLPVTAQLWIDGNQTVRQSEWSQAQWNGWTVKLPADGEDRTCVEYIKDRIRRATQRARSGQREAICLIAHSDRYAREARQFCKAGGQLLLVGYVGYFQRRLYELSESGVEMRDIEYDCRSSHVRLRESPGWTPYPAQTPKATKQPSRLGAAEG